MEFKVETKKLLLFIYIACVMLFQDGDYVRLAMRVVFIVGSFILWLVHPYVEKKMDGIYFWMICFFAVCALSIKWAISPSVARAMTFTVFLNLVCIFFVYNYLKYDPSLLLFGAKCLVFFPVVLGVMSFGRHGLLVFVINRTAGGLLNANTIALESAFAVAIGFFLISEAKELLSKRTAFCLKISIPLNALFVLLTASRKGLIVLILPIVVYQILSAKNIIKVFKYILAGILLASVVYYLIMNVEFLYEIIGNRVEGLLNYFLNSGSVDDSTSTRMMMIEYGKQWFYESPLLGKGIDNYRNLMGSAKKLNTYAHNNFIELAVDIGIIGLISYYLLYLINIKTMFKRHFFSSKVRIFAFACLITLLISDYGLVSYFDKYLNLCLCIVTFIITKFENDYEYVEGYNK